MHGTIHIGNLMGDDRVPAQQTTIIPDSHAAANQLSRTFEYQSYFDSTLLEKAILTQAPNNPIVQSTKEQQQVSGWAIGNHPDSQTPVAVTFSGDGRQSGSSSHIIPPGAIVRPTGGSANRQGGFQSFQWGLPFGWLGGGTATIVVFQTPTSWANWNVRNQLIFHRFRAEIYAPSDLPLRAAISSWPRNWPTRFPSLITRRQESAVTIGQGGAPQIAISQPGMVELQLHTTISSTSSMKALFLHTTDFSDEITVLPTPIQIGSVEFEVPARTSYVYPAGVYTEYTIFEAPLALSRLGCNGKAGSSVSLNSGVIFVSDDPQLQGQFMDVVRYGYL